MKTECDQDWPLEHNADPHHHQSTCDQASRSLKHQGGLWVKKKKNLYVADLFWSKKVNMLCCKATANLVVKGQGRHDLCPKVIMV